MTYHKMKLDPHPFESMLKGEKVFELRLYDDKRKEISVNDRIVFKKLQEPAEILTVVVKSLHIFPDFESMYNFIPLDKMGYSKSTIKTASYKDMYQYYTKEEEEKNGCVAIGVQLVQGETYNEITDRTSDPFLLI